MDVDLGHLSQPCAGEGTEENGLEEIRIESEMLEDLDEILIEYQNPVLICDSNTRAAAEPILEEEFKDYMVIELDPEGLALDDETIANVMSQLEACEMGQSTVPVDMLVAIGEGVLYDLTCHAAGVYDIPIVSVKL